MYALPETGIIEASSANASAEKMHVSPASENERITAGPDTPIASPMITKMLAPMIAPRPSAVRSKAPISRFSEASRFLVSASSASIGLRANGPRSIVAIEALLGSSVLGARDPSARAVEATARAQR